MSYVAARLLRVPFVVVLVGAVLIAAVPAAMRQYDAFQVGHAQSCISVVQGPFGRATVFNCEQTLANLYHRPLNELMADAAARSLVLLAGAALLGLSLGGLLGVALALMRRRALASGGIVGLLALLAAIPSFFLAYFLQMLVILLGSGDQGGHVLPVYGFGYDEHIVLPLLSISVPAIAFTAQLVATRMQDVLDADFVTTANAKGLLQSRIVGVHVLPHVRPVLFEALGSGLRVSVASLPIVEFLFSWNGIGALALQSVGVRDAAAFVYAAVALVAVFAVLGAVADLARPRALYRV